MNKHFQDTRYYLKRAGETTKAGVVEELKPVETRVRGFTVRESEPKPRRVDVVRAEIVGFGERAEDRTRTAIRTGRKKLGTRRRERTAA
ncbi:hypothetical protein KY092_07320 [Natronomonas gomsonensis]|uniref:DUF7553 family protein n=1 Tax=Natronomonas gomsonensis TaxID=1046043 RepID=UPI0020CA8358|nr:hypothetical protein [Natronomonas gomsonensis]MCY4730364.1 hypothetical protein [Natronomonas gomsonensis]